MSFTGYFMLVLHAHLPYVRHPEYDDFLEEDWLYEAITETYIPLIDMGERLLMEEVDFRLTLSLTPPLLTMLSDPLLQGRYLKKIEKLIELSEHEIERTRWQKEFNVCAQMYLNNFKKAREIFLRYNYNLIDAFKRLQASGCLEIITCGATHGYLPLNINEVARRAQIEVAVETHKQFLGQAPRGIWLPECGFTEGIDQILKEYGIRYFFIDTHGIFYGSPRPKYGIYAPVYTPGGVAALGRDVESSKQVWSAKEGYPGDYAYRDFYRDIGFDLEYDYIQPYMHSTGIRTPLGIKYYKITGPDDHKETYDPQYAEHKAAEHAGNFMFNRQKQVEYLYGVMNKKPLIVSPYDAELFGHWWYEGPKFIEYLFRKLYYDQKKLKPVTASEYLAENPRLQVVTPTASSWGYKGYNEQWLAGPNAWIYSHLHKATERMIELADTFNNTDDLYTRALNQAVRELLLAQSSDWAFIMKTGTMVEYAVNRTRTHIERFNRLYWGIKNNCIDTDWLADIEYKDNIFPNINYKLYTSNSKKNIKEKVLVR